MSTMQVVAGYAHKQMVLAMIVHPIGRNGRAFDDVCIGGASMCERIVAASRGAGMLRDVADA